MFVWLLESARNQLHPPRTLARVANNSLAAPKVVIIATNLLQCNHQNIPLNRRVTCLIFAVDLTAFGSAGLLGFKASWELVVIYCHLKRWGSNQ